MCLCALLDSQDCRCCGVRLKTTAGCSRKAHSVMSLDATRYFFHRQRAHPKHDVFLERALTDGTTRLLQKSAQRLVVPRGILAWSAKQRRVPDIVEDLAALGQEHVGKRCQSEETLVRAHRLLDILSQSRHAQKFSACLSQRRCLSAKLRAHRELLNDPEANPASLCAFALALQFARRASLLLANLALVCHSVTLYCTTCILTSMVSSLGDMRHLAPPSNKNQKERRQNLFMTPQKLASSMTAVETLGWVQARCGVQQHGITSKATQHCCENNRHNIHFFMTN